VRDVKRRLAALEKNMGKRKVASDNDAGNGNETQTRDGLYSNIGISDAELEAIAEAAANPAVDDILPFLLVKIRRAFQEGAKLEAISSGCSAYVSALKARHVITGKAAKNLEMALEQAVLEVGAEFGIAL
jgi:hypothetical protein